MQHLVSILAKQKVKRERFSGETRVDSEIGLMMGKIHKQLNTGQQHSREKLLAEPKPSVTASLMSEDRSQGGGAGEDLV